jgi:hypothetical protein
MKRSTRSLSSSPASRAGAFALAGLFVAGVVAACGGSSGKSGFGTGDGDAGGGGLLGNGGLGGGSGGVVGLGDAACASSTSRGQQAPLDMYIMLDQSQSMSEQVAGNTSKWAAVTSALDSFVTGANTAGISVGIQYFGVPPGGSSTPMCQSSCTTTTDCGPAADGPCLFGLCVGCLASLASNFGGDSCTAADYAKPDVEIAPLPGAGAALSASIAKHGPSTDTPTSAALQGAVDHAQAWAKAHTNDVVIAVLATDGDPTECDTTLSDIDAIAATGVSGTPKVLTFVIGVGTSTAALNGIAAAGGTSSAFLVDTTQNVNQQFLAALDKIRGTALGCNYTIPIPTNGTPNFNEINVEYTPGNGGATELVPRVDGAAQCPATGSAWYYDDPTAPTQIILCPSTCTTVLGDSSGNLEVLIGCATVAR